MELCLIPLQIGRKNSVYCNKKSQDMFLSGCKESEIQHLLFIILYVVVRYVTRVNWFSSRSAFTCEKVIFLGTSFIYPYNVNIFNVNIHSD